MRSHPASSSLGVALCDMLLMQQTPELAHMLVFISHVIFPITSSHHVVDGSRHVMFQ